MVNFASIDFETANKEQSSVCSVGVIVVRDGIIREKIYSLIKPVPNYYAYWNTVIHGITRIDTDTAALFPEVWKPIARQIEGLPLIAHNSPFDEGCLKAVYRVYGMDYPAYTFHCTYRAARRSFPYLPNHKLHTVAAHCGFDLHNHHHALADAEACAAIALHLFSGSII